MNICIHIVKCMRNKDKKEIGRFLDDTPTLTLKSQGLTLGRRYFDCMKICPNLLQLPFKHKLINDSPYWMVLHEAMSHFIYPSSAQG